MTILSVAYPFAPVSSDAVGGAEQVVSMLDRGLVASGLDSIVMGASGSIITGGLIQFESSKYIDQEVRRRTHSQYAKAIAEAIDELPLDLIHMHGVDFAQYIPNTTLPVLVTLHLPLHFYQIAACGRDHHVTFNAVSQWQKQRCPSELDAQLVCNGVDVESFYPAAEKQDFVLALGRICPEKGFHLALEAAASAAAPCILAGQVYGYPEHLHYYNCEILPRLDSQRRFIGPIGGVLKRRLLSAAKCLLIPSLVAETSSLAAMEALACGTPVVAFRAGALVDVVSHGRTGFLVDSVDEMARAVSVVDQIDPCTCRDEACRRFSATRMVRDYLRLYQAVIERH